MVEVLIERNNAILAKEKGFDWECLAVLNIYEDDSSSIGTYELTRNSKLAKIQYALPSQSLLQKWLREVHKIHVLVEPFNDREAKQVLYDNIIISINDDWNKDSTYNFTPSYEESLEEALTMALKNIS